MRNLNYFGPLWTCEVAVVVLRSLATTWIVYTAEIRSSKWAPRIFGNENASKVSGGHFQQVATAS